jgi:hypothetical protein
MNALEVTSSCATLDTDMKADKMHPADAKRFIKSCLESGEFIIIPHARDAMADDALDERDVINILLGGVVQQPEWENNEWRYQIKTQKMVAVVGLYQDPNQVRVVTVWLMRRR